MQFRLTWLIWIVSYVLASFQTQLGDETSAEELDTTSTEELLPMADHRSTSETIGLHSVWSTFGAIIRNDRYSRSTGERALSCQQTTIESFKAVVSLASIGLMLHLKTNFIQLCSSNHEVIMLTLVSLFGLGLMESLIGIIGVSTNCCKRLNIRVNQELESQTRRGLRQGINIVGGIGVLLGIVKTAGVVNYLTHNVDTPICDTKGTNGLFDSDIAQVIVITSVLQMIAVLVSLGMAFVHDREQ